MCLAIPGKVVELKENGKIAVIDYGFERRDVDNSFAKANAGDWVLVQFRMVIKKLDEKEAKKMLAAWKSTTRQGDSEKM